MAKFEKRVIGPGIYSTPDGVEEVDAARIRHWHDTVTAMMAAGHKPPVSWGHSRDAYPHPDEHAFWKSRLNAGKVIGSRIDPLTGEWVLAGDAPGVEQDAEGRLITEAEVGGRRVRTCIEEVSVGAMDWTDGTGRVWKDAPVHLALTPLPVWVPEGGQPPFEKFFEHEGAAKASRFSTSTLLLSRFAAMPDDAKKDEGEKKAPPKKEGDGDEKAFNLKGLVEALREVGINVPDEVDDCDKLIVAIKAGGGGEGGMAPPPPEKKDEAATPQEAGAFLSTIRDPLTRQLMDDKIKGDGVKRQERIKALEGRGLPGHAAKALRGESTLVRFGLDTAGKLLRHPLDEKLDLLEAAMPQAPGGFDRAFLGTATAEEAPEEQKTNTRRREIVDEAARNAGLPRAKAAAN